MPDVNAATPAPTSAVRVLWSVKIPLRDGVQLNATVYLPGSPAPSPAILLLTPYVGQTFHEYAVYFATQGYPFLAVDVRGRGNSQGEFHPLNESDDSYDVIEWLARQSYCDGRVALWGGSYSGYVQWASTKTLSPHLATMAPVAAPYRGIDSPARNNIFLPYTLQWLTLIQGATAQDKIFADERFWAAQFRRAFESGTAFRKLDEWLGNPSKLFQEWISHPEVDEYWDSYNPSAADYARLSIPVLTITGLYDGDQAGALMHYRQHMKNASADGRARHCLVIGPWDHAGTRAPKEEFGGLRVGAASLVDLRRLHVEWYAWTLRGGQRPSFLKNNVAYYVTGAERWRYADSLESITSRRQALYLNSTRNPTDVFASGSLVAEGPGDSGPDHYVYDPCDVTIAQTEYSVPSDSLVDQRILYASHGKRLIYHSAPFEESIEISGFFKLSAWIAIDQPDTDIRVWIYEIDVHGRSVLLASDSVRARYREHLRRPELIDTREPLLYTFDSFTFISRVVARFSRLRLVVGPINSMYSQKNYNSGGVISDESMADARTVTVRLFHSESHPAVLHVPIGQPMETQARD